MQVGLVELLLLSYGAAAAGPFAGLGSAIGAIALEHGWIAGLAWERRAHSRGLLTAEAADPLSPALSCCRAERARLGLFCFVRQFRFERHSFRGVSNNTNRANLNSNTKLG